MSSDCALSVGNCVVGSDTHKSSVCISTGMLELNGTKNGDSLATISRVDTNVKYRFFTVVGDSQLTLRMVKVTGGDVSSLYQNPCWACGYGGAFVKRNDLELMVWISNKRTLG